MDTLFTNQGEETFVTTPANHKFPHPTINQNSSPLLYTVRNTYIMNSRERITKLEVVHLIILGYSSQKTNLDTSQGLDLRHLLTLKAHILSSSLTMPPTINPFYFLSLTPSYICHLFSSINCLCLYSAAISLLQPSHLCQSYNVQD